MKRCVQCLNYFNKITKDHVFPSSWYPITTPTNIQRWTVPTCKNCNGKFGKLEHEALIILGLCIDPEKLEAAGLAEKALVSLGLNVELDPEEKQHRVNKAKRILSRIQPYSPSVKPFPGLGPHQGYPKEDQWMIKGYERDLFAIGEKILRGIEYKLGKRFIERQAKLTVYFPNLEDLDPVNDLFRQIGSNILGPGFIVQRGAAIDNEFTVIYKIIMLGSITMYGSLLEIKME